MLFFWVVIFLVSLVILVKGADWLLESSEKIGLAAGLSPFVIGVTIVAVGTSFPELVSSLFAVFRGAPEIVAANAIGSNIANILLIVGFSAVLARKLVVSKSLINIDLPLLATSTVLLLAIVWDRHISIGESILLLAGYGIYVAYTILHNEKDDTDGIENPSEELLSKNIKGEHSAVSGEEIAARPRTNFRDFVFLGLGIAGLVFGAKYLIDSVIALSAILNIGSGVIAITAVALGTSLPELLVSAKAALQKKSEVALGNIFGSNVFNALVVIGLPGLFGALSLDQQTFAVGVPVMVMATLLFVISGISRKIYIWEGSFFLLLYVLFLAKLFNLF